MNFILIKGRGSYMKMLDYLNSFENIWKEVTLTNNPYEPNPKERLAVVRECDNLYYGYLVDRNGLEWNLGAYNPFVIPKSWIKGEDKMRNDEFKVGDRVFDVRYGYGRVVEIEKVGDYPINVKLENDGYKSNVIHTYSVNGKINGGNRVLFFQEIPIPKEVMVRPRWRAERGEKYYFIDAVGDVVYTRESNIYGDDLKYKIGNYFHTTEESKQSKIYKAFHEGDE